MVLSKADKIKLIHSLSSKHKDELRRAIMKGQGGGGIKTVLSNIADTLKPIVKVVGMTVLKEVLIPALKHKVMGSGLRLAGQRGKGKKKGKKGGMIGQVPPY